MKIKLDRELCEANGMCMDECPEVFRLDDSDWLHVDETAASRATGDGELRERLEQAARRCPRQALELDA